MIRENCPEAAANAVVRRAYQLALVRLRQLMNSGRLHLHSFGIPVEGVAFDCIAELFQRDEEGRFVDIADYFSGDRSMDLMDEDEARHHFRVLVFRKLQDGISRLYRENDPILSRLIRNIKVAFCGTPGIVVMP